VYERLMLGRIQV